MGPLGHESTIILPVNSIFPAQSPNSVFFLLILILALTLTLLPRCHYCVPLPLPLPFLGLPLGPLDGRCPLDGPGPGCSKLSVSEVPTLAVQAVVLFPP